MNKTELSILRSGRLDQVVALVPTLYVGTEGANVIVAIYQDLVDKSEVEIEEVFSNLYCCFGASRISCRDSLLIVGSLAALLHGRKGDRHPLSYTIPQLSESKLVNETLAEYSNCVCIWPESILEELSSQNSGLDTFCQRAILVTIFAWVWENSFRQQSVLRNWVIEFARTLGNEDHSFFTSKLLLRKLHIP